MVDRTAGAGSLLPPHWWPCPKCRVAAIGQLNVNSHMLDHRLARLTAPTLYYTAQTPPNCFPLYCTALNYTALHYITLPALHHTTLHCRNTRRRTFLLAEILFQVVADSGAVRLPWPSLVISCSGPTKPPQFGHIRFRHSHLVWDHYLVQDHRLVQDRCTGLSVYTYINIYIYIFFCVSVIIIHNHFFTTAIDILPLRYVVYICS